MDLLVLLLMLMSTRQVSAVEGEDDWSDPGEGTTDCEDGFVMLMPTEIDFTHSGDVESVTVVAIDIYGGDVEVRLDLVNDDGTAADDFGFYEQDRHCDNAAGPSSCSLTVSAGMGEWPVIPLVFDADENSQVRPDDEPSGDIIGWVKVTWTGSSGVECEGNAAMLDAYVS